MIFVVYQALPPDMVPDRNDDLIFNQIGWLFPINMIWNALWLPTFQSFNTVGFVLSEVLIVGMLLTAIVSAERAVNAANNG